MRSVVTIIAIIKFIVFETRYPKLIKRHTTTNDINEANNVFRVNIIVIFSYIIKIREIKKIPKNKKKPEPV